MGLKRTSSTKHRAPGPPTRVIIVADFGPDVQRYRDEFAHLTFPRPLSCPGGAATKPLVGHGSYGRQPCDDKQVFSIRVKRFFCTVCRHTVSILPSFCLPYRHYLASTIQRVLAWRFSEGASWKAVCELFSPSQVPGLSSCREWVASFAQASDPYLQHLLHQLATWQLAPGKLEMALADITAGHQSPRQLLAAVPHLLAWLHDRGMTIGEGGKRWLPTLGIWGQLCKLGRLV